MKGKKLITILLTVLVFLSAIVLGASTVYRVDDVRVDIVAISEEGKAEAERLQAKLKEAYHRQSIFFTKQTETEETLAQFPYLRLVSFSRAYPDLLVVTVSEDAEAYAASKNGTGAPYVIMNADGIVLGERDNYVNRENAALQVNNVLLAGRRGDTLLTSAECLETFFPFCQTLSSLLNGTIRANVRSIEFVAPSSQAQQSYFCIQTAEGVKIYIFDPETDAAGKTAQALQTYFALTDAQKMTGRIAVMKTAQGIRTEYSETDGFAENGN